MLTPLLIQPPQFLGSHLLKLLSSRQRSGSVSKIDVPMVLSDGVENASEDEQTNADGSRT